MARPVIALLTDFGTSDHYAGVLKGVVLGICPDAVLVDLTHDIPPQDIQTAALELAAAYRYFPPGTIFLVVVDPGVGTSRRAIGAETAGYYFVGPDNGVLAGVFDEAAPSQLVELSERRYARSVISHTFEGRDRFAPAAAWLATGVPLSAFGPVIEGYVPLALPRPVVRARTITGEVVRIDRFGNLVTNIDRSAVEAVCPEPSAACIEVGGRRIVGLVLTYADAPIGALCGLFGSSDYLEIGERGGSAARLLAVSRGAPVQLIVQRDSISGRR